MALRPLASRPAGRFRMPPLPGWAGGGIEPLRIGLLNNMPDAAFAATERQFRRILSAPGAPLADLQFFTLSGMKRACGFRAEVAAAYASHERLPEAGLDALIVTGCEPREGPLGREPWFRAFGEVVDWARTNTSSTLFSCLATARSPGRTRSWPAPRRACPCRIRAGTTSPRTTSRPPAATASCAARAPSGSISS
jgi:hypothetical protein